ncbi:hypothetical protein BHF71_00030 [Vulcanibacillus modesticaldus]|uniref:Tetratricopeptide repeat protein n=1 Tax=Vulcanibacillus modesticaldus TaxID=337097 RepID=A0A1D2YX87_9BACI|nr:tetratricopeptide repeat protein [Vulcanibacillus modesticaldus]OEG00334.1 hypothetical protein BHF71_00030 [Vulcanibacillus modesticaldus]
MFQDLFSQMHQTLDQLNYEFGTVDDIDEELTLLEKYLTVKEMSEEITSELNKLIVKIQQFEKDHGLTDLDFQTDQELHNSSNTEHGMNLDAGLDDEVVVEIDEDDFLTFQKGIGFYDLFMYDQAIIHLENIIKKYPDFNLARLYTAMTYLKKKDYNRAKREVLLLFKFSDDHDLISLGHNILGTIYSYEHEYNQAIFHFQQAINLKNNWTEPKFNLAIIYYQINRFHDAINSFRELYDVHSEDWEVVLYLGKCYQKLKQYKKANEYLKEAYEIIQKPLIIKQIAHHFEEQRHFKKAIYWYRKWLKQEPKSFEALLGLAKNTWLSGDKATGLALLKKTLTIYHQNPEALLLYAWILTDNNDKMALLVIDKLMEIVKGVNNNQNFYLIANLARLFYLNND